MSKTPQKGTSSSSRSGKREFASYVVWEGRNPGVYTSWRDCSEQVNGYSNNVYKGFYSNEEARAAFESKPYSTAYEGSSSQKCPNCQSPRYLSSKEKSIYDPMEDFKPGVFHRL